MELANRTTTTSGLIGVHPRDVQFVPEKHDRNFWMLVPGSCRRRQQRDQQNELLEYWAKLSNHQQQSVFELVKMLAAKKSRLSLERRGSSSIH